MGSLSVREIPYRSAIRGDWENMVDCYAKLPEQLLRPVTLSLDTGFHLAVHSNKGKPLEDLLKIMETGESSSEREYLKRKNKFGNTALHEATIIGNYEAVRLLVERCADLLSIPNEDGETPLFTAAGFGQAGIVKFLILSQQEQCVNDQWRLLPIHRHRSKDKQSILETALLLLEVDAWLHSMEDSKKRTALQPLAEIPSAFESGFPMGIFQRLFYCCLPARRHHEIKLEEETTEQAILRVVWGAARRRIQKAARSPEKRQISLLLATGNGIEEIVRGIIKQFPRAIKKLNVQNSSLTWKGRIPLFIATRNGIEEIVRETIKLYPHAVEQLNEKGQSILNVAVMHRQEKIFSLVKQQKIPMARLHRVLDEEGNTLLHHVADMEHYRGGTKPGPALQLQEELQWFETVKNSIVMLMKLRDVIPSHYGTLPNDEGKTAEDLFKASHKEQLENARTWIKETTQSCSTVSAFVATVVFAAAYTVPGGSDENGTPNFIDSPYFLVFTVSDVLSLASSLTSLVVFLSLLTSRYELKEFHISLPRKLLVGFTFLFFAVTMTMLSFGATIFILFQSKRKLTTSFLSIAAFLPVLVFATMQFRLYVFIMGSACNIRKKTGKALPPFLFPCLPRGETLSRVD
ncbi:hypothetical protein SADUNF_Sadunf11G0064900 [Salix dunnii]|uniref:PGG domain-containing protein n=1 Tax=Salix dunnii TaxID=1413687 RepID=A0A835JQ89_9ROSI|nr:hypothetical protein SADUNF_Sadunf11G0064900 [Salix dunnii]